MSLNLLSYLNGISATLVFMIGLFFSIRFLMYFRQFGKKLMPLVSLLALFLGSLYLGGTVSFFYKLITSEDLNYILYGFLSYGHVPIGVSISMYLGYDIFKPELKKRIVTIFATSGLIYLIILVVWPTTMIEHSNPAPDELIDISINSVILIMVVLYILSVIIMLGVNFLLLRKRLTEFEPRTRALYQGIGWVLFGIGGILDSLVPLSFVILPRIVMIIAYILIFVGFSPMKQE